MSCFKKGQREKHADSAKLPCKDFNVIASVQRAVTHNTGGIWMHIDQVGLSRGFRLNRTASGVSGDDWRNMAIPEERMRTAKLPSIALNLKKDGII